MLSPVNGFRALGVATLLFINHICTLARLCGADERFADLYQETRVQRSSTRTAVTAEANHALSVLEWSNKEEGMLSGTGERRLHAEEKKEVQLIETVKEKVPARSLESEFAIEDAVSLRTPDIEASTTSISLIERNADTGRRRRRRLAAKKISAEGAHGRVRQPEVRLDLRLNYGAGTSAHKTRPRPQPYEYSKYWKPAWIAGVALGSALVASTYGSGLNLDYIGQVEDAAGVYPGGRSPEDYKMYKALVRLAAGVYTLAFTGISYLIVQHRRKKRRRSAKGTEDKSA